MATEDRKTEVDAVADAGAETRLDASPSQNRHEFSVPPEATLPIEEVDFSAWMKRVPGLQRQFDFNALAHWSVDGVFFPPGFDPVTCKWVHYAYEEAFQAGFLWSTETQNWVGMPEPEPEWVPELVVDELPVEELTASRLLEPTSDSTPEAVTSKLADDAVSEIEVVIPKPGNGRAARAAIAAFLTGSTRDESDPQPLTAEPVQAASTLHEEPPELPASQPTSDDRLSELDLESLVASALCPTLARDPESTPGPSIASAEPEPTEATVIPFERPVELAEKPPRIRSIATVEDFPIVESAALQAMAFEILWSGPIVEPPRPFTRRRR